jgi:hypothetical protein
VVQIAVADTLVALADLGMVVVAWVSWAALGKGSWHFSICHEREHECFRVQKSSGSYFNS